MSLKLLVLIILVLVAVGIIFASWKLSHDQETKDEETCLIRTNYGYVNGRRRVGITEKKQFYSFHGIPYAKPPIGPLRFKDPQPANPWYGEVHDATKEGNICPQGGRGSEDCLFINVYNTECRNMYNKLQPVMFFIHGGGFIAGSGNEDYLGPEFLVENDVVVVTFNYRLGVFGFLSLENEDIPGNAGLKDQVLALEWVQQNIAHFGGNPNNVTIFGNSAGGGSVHYHVLSSMSSGLFHSAIVQSGVANNPWAVQAEPVRRAFMVGSLLGSNATTDESLIKFLRSMLAFDLEKVQFDVKTGTGDTRCLELAFSPSIEKDTFGKHFVVEHPKKLLSTGRFNKVPMIFGTVDKEGAVLLEFTRNDAEMVSGFKKFLPGDLKLNNDSQEYKELENKIRKYYFHEKAINVEESLAEFTDICGDLIFLIGIHQTINFTLHYSPFPVYVYQFSFDGQYGNYKKRMKELWRGINVTFPIGTFHGDDVGYIFNLKFGEAYDTDTKDFKMLKYLSTLWTNFAKYHNPNMINDYTWQPTEIDNPTYLRFGDPTKLEYTYLSPNRTKMWDEIYAKYG